MLGVLMLMGWSLEVDGKGNGMGWDGRSGSEVEWAWESLVLWRDQFIMPSTSTCCLLCKLEESATLPLLLTSLSRTFFFERDFNDSPR